MRKSLETAVDVASTVMAGAVLYASAAPWWAYFLILLFGAAQQLVGRQRGQNALRRTARANLIAIITRNGAPR